jgi:hypothetical protein
MSTGTIIHYTKPYDDSTGTASTTACMLLTCISAYVRTFDVATAAAMYDDHRSTNSVCLPLLIMLCLSR